MDRRCNYCGLVKHAFEEPMSDFSYKRRYRVDGSYMVQYDGKCKVCRRLLDRSRRIKETTQKVLHHTGPLDKIEKLLFCQIKPTNPDKESRYDLGR